MDVRRAKKLLKAQLAELEPQDGRVHSGDGEALPAHGAVSQHPADVGTDLANEMERQLMARTLDRERQQIRDALQRIEDGTYGRCRVDGEPIADARLEARPEADLCLRHQEEIERRATPAAPGPVRSA